MYPKIKVQPGLERDHKNIVQWTMHPEPGGHYAAHLEPDALADDIPGFYAALASAASVT